MKPRESPLPPARNLCRAVHLNAPNARGAAAAALPSSLGACTRIGSVHAVRLLLGSWGSPIAISRHVLPYHVISRSLSVDMSTSRAASFTALVTAAASSALTDRSHTHTHRSDCWAAPGHSSLLLLTPPYSCSLLLTPAHSSRLIASRIHDGRPHPERREAAGTASSRRSSQPLG